MDSIDEIVRERNCDYYSIRMTVSMLFVAIMLAFIVSLSLYLREVFCAIRAFEIALPQMMSASSESHMHAAQVRSSPLYG